MASGKGLLVNALGRLLLTESTVIARRAVSANLCVVELEGAELRAAAWIAGDKIQVLLPSLETRTYTPTRWDRATGRTELVIYSHGDAPGAAWGRTVAVGDACRFVGPQRSIAAPSGQGVVLFGDETSFGVAKALSSQSAVTALFEVTATAASAEALAAIGVAAPSLVQRTAGDAHIAAVVEQLGAAIARQPESKLLLTGRAQAIQAIRTKLAASRFARKSTNRAYWSLGKRGLD